MNREKIKILVLILGATLAVVILSFIKNDKIKHSSITSFSKSATGMSIFQQLAARIGLSSLELKKTALLEENELSGIDALFILSPTAAVSERESTLIQKFVNDGGHLYLSFHNELTWRNLANLGPKLNFYIATENWPDFRNQEAKSLTPSKDFFLFKEGKEYTFYGMLLFPQKDCSKNLFDCFVQELKYGKGQIFVFAGLPPFGNALIGHTDNSEIAFTILTKYSKILVDEYHHFFTDKNIYDLLALPSFSLPIIGLILSAILFFLFGHTDFHDNHQKEETDKSSRDYHELNENILANLLNSAKPLSAAIEKQSGFLCLLFPMAAERINKQIATIRHTPEEKNKILLKAKMLVNLHQQLLNELRGRKS